MEAVDDIQKLLNKKTALQTDEIMKVVVLMNDGRKLGYVPEKDNVIFARLMDAGKLLKAKVTKKNKKGSFTQISIGIYMVDF
ncbi:MAG: hypothetical protein LUF92_03955 [Clostridiales bacterium]|nr:hypothetical protein [Clostridiales bacterium]